MNIIPRRLTQKNSIWKRNVLLPFFKKNEAVLDFGCGDLSLARSLKERIPYLKMSGVDVVDFSERPKNIGFAVYDGKTLPFKNNSFDTVIAFYVLHHCENAEESFKECLRVAKKRVLIVESLPRNRMEMPFVKLMDWFYNIIKPEPIPLTYQFHTLVEWKKIFNKHKATLKKKQSFKPSTLAIFAVGEQCVMDIRKIT